MCLSIPCKIIQIEKNSAIIDNGKKNIKVNISLIQNPKINDWLLVHANLAIKKISNMEADEIKKLISSSLFLKK